MWVPATSATSLLASYRLVVHQAAELCWRRGGGGGGGREAAHKIRYVQGCTYEEWEESSHEGGQDQVDDSGNKAL